MFRMVRGHKLPGGVAAGDSKLGETMFQSYRVSDWLKSPCIPFVSLCYVLVTPLTTELSQGPKSAELGNSAIKDTCWQGVRPPFIPGCAGLTAAQSMSHSDGGRIQSGLEQLSHGEFSQVLWVMHALGTEHRRRMVDTILLLWRWVDKSQPYTGLLGVT